MAIIPQEAIIDFMTLKPSSVTIYCALCQVKDSREDDVYFSEAKAADYRIGRSAYFQSLKELQSKGWIEFSRKENGKTYWRLLKGFTSQKSTNVDNESPQTWTNDEVKVHKRGLKSPQSWTEKSINVDFPSDSPIRINSTKKNSTKGGGGSVEYSTPAREADEVEPPPPNPVQVYFEIENAVDNDVVVKNPAYQIWQDVFEIELNQKLQDYLRDKIPIPDEDLLRQVFMEWDANPKWAKNNVAGQVSRYEKEVKRSKDDGKYKSERERREHDKFVEAQFFAEIERRAFES